MQCWLVCKTCDARELVQDQTDFGPCPHCGGGPRFAKGDKDQDMFVVVGEHDFTEWK